MKIARFLWGFSLFLGLTAAHAEVVSKKVAAGHKLIALAELRVTLSGYNRAQASYEKSGPQGFVEHFPANMPAVDKKALLKLLTQMPELPKLSLEGDTIWLAFNDGTKLAFDAHKVIDGRFQNDEIDLVYNYQRNALENLEDYQAQQRKLKKQSGLLRVWQNLQAHVLSLILPQAQAKSSTLKTVGIVAVGAYIGVTLIPKLVGLIGGAFGGSGSGAGGH